MKTLGVIFHGPLSADEMTRVSDESTKEPRVDRATESAAARVLYLLITQRWYRSFWPEVLKKAALIALTDDALAAINLITAVLTANWSIIPHWPVSTGEDSSFVEDVLGGREPPIATFIRSTERNFLTHSSEGQTGPISTGLDAIKSAPGVVGYLMAPYVEFSPARHDRDSAEYRVGMAKHAAVKTLRRRLAELEKPTPHDRMLLSSADKLIAKGPFSTPQPRVAMASR